MKKIEPNLPRLDRDPLVDVAKGLGIVAIFLGHLTYWGSPISKFVFSFHLSLFFYLSGCVFMPEKYEGIRTLLCRIWRAFGVPYLFFVLLGLAVISFRDASASWLHIFKSVFYTGHPAANGPCWFLVSLAEVQVVYWLLHRVSVRCRFDLMLVFLALCATLLVTCLLKAFPLIRGYVPLKLETLPVALFFFVSGRLSRRIPRMIETNRMSGHTTVGVVVALIGAMVLLCNLAKPSCLQGSMIRDFYFFPLSFLGIFLVLFLSKVILSARWVTYVGRNSLIFFALEFVTMPVLLSVWHIFDSRYVFYPLNHQIPLCSSMVLLVLQLLLIGFCVKPCGMLLNSVRRLVCQR